MKKGGEKKNRKKYPARNRRLGVGVLKDERGDLFLPGLCLAISKQPCLSGTPFSCPAHYCVLYSALLGGAGHCSTLQSCRASVKGCVLCLAVGVCKV